MFLSKFSTTSSLVFQPIYTHMRSYQSRRTIDDLERKKMLADIHSGKARHRVDLIINLFNDGHSLGEQNAAGEALRKFYFNRGFKLLFVDVIKKIEEDKTADKATSMEKRTIDRKDSFITIAIILAVSLIILSKDSEDKTVTELEINDPNITNEKLKRIIQKYPNLQSIKINCSDKITEQGVKELSALKCLKKLELKNIKIKDGTAREIANLQTLKKLKLKECVEIKTEGFREIAKLKNLKKLSLGFFSSTDKNESLDEIIKLTTLKILDLSDCGIRRGNFKKLALMNNLEVINIKNMRYYLIGDYLIGDLYLENNSELNFEEELKSLLELNLKETRIIS